MKPQSMTYPFEVKDRFVELRALGITMAEATKELVPFQVGFYAE
jgi:hypothetical protein